MLGQVPTYTISTIAGDGTAAFLGDSGQATAAELNSPCALAFDKSGNLFVADSANSRVRRIGTDGVITTVAGKGTNAFSGDGKAATDAEISFPCGLAFDSSGNLLIADGSNNAIRKVASSNISTIVNTAAVAGYSGDAGGAAGAYLYHPTAIAVDSKGVLYIADTKNNVIRKVGTDGNISTFAGNGKADRGPDGVAATSTSLNNPQGLAVDSAGNVYIADTGNGLVRKVLASDGTIVTVAGIDSPAPTFLGDGGLATKAALRYPKGLVIDGAGNLFIADSQNLRVRVVLAGGIITTVAGNGRQGFTGDGGSATQANLNFPGGLAMDGSGNLIIADSGNNRLRKLTPGANPPTITRGVFSASGFGGFASVAPGSWVEIFGTNLASTTRTWNGNDFTAGGLGAPTSLEGTKVTVGGLPAYVSYISPAQVNAQLPSNLSSGPQPLTVTTAQGITAAYTLNVNATQPGLLAPQSFSIGGKQYVVSLFLDGTTYVLPEGALAGVASRPAKPGETILMFGIGFGPVTPSVNAGVVVQNQNTLVNPVQILIGGVPAQVGYQGLAPSTVGLYQFNVTVPNVAAASAAPVTFSQAGVAGTQTLYIATGN
jgi:uncharacterized protein (TIGR03437 family)